MTEELINPGSSQRDQRATSGSDFYVGEATQSSIIFVLFG
jgi:hypothetical protein